MSTVYLLVAAAMAISSLIHLLYFLIARDRFVARDVFKPVETSVVDWGGIPLYLSVLLSLILSHIFGLLDLPTVLGVSLSLSIGFISGLVDDILPSLPGYFKPLTTALAALPLILLGLYTPQLRIFDGYVYNLPIIYPLLMLGGFAISANAVNMLDVINGSALIGSFIVVYTASLAAVLVGSTPVVPLVFLSCIVPLAYLNMYPARMFLGNSGALMLGVMIGVSAVLLDVETVVIFSMYPFLVNGLFYLIRFRGFLERRRHGYRVAALGSDGLIHDMCEEGAPLVLLKYLVASKPKSELRVLYEIILLFIFSSLVGLAIYLVI